MVMFGKNKDIIKFYASVNGLEKNEKLCPIPAKKYLPSWWTSIPNVYESEPTIRRCPAIPDFFTQGYVIPMWRDIRINGVVEKNNVDWTPLNDRSKSFGRLTGHKDLMFLDHFDFTIGNKEPQAVVKFDSPWYVITPKGWSTLVLPLSYEFNENFTILPGVVDTDIIHQMNHPAILHCDNKPFDINAGDPLVMYIPFKRTKSNYEIIKKNKKMDDYLLSVSADWANKNYDKNHGNGGLNNAYRKMQKEKRDDF
jgi:hypothetical protein